MKKILTILILNTALMTAMYLIYTNFNGYDVFEAVENPHRKVVLRHYFMQISLTALLIVNFVLTRRIIMSPEP